MAENSRNLRPPPFGVDNGFEWRQFMETLADMYQNGLLLPDFASDPPTTEYRMYYNTTLNQPCYYNGTIWVAI